MTFRIRYRIFGNSFNFAVYVDFDTGEVDECGLKETLYLMPCKILRISSMNDVARAKNMIKSWALKIQKRTKFDGDEEQWDEREIIDFWF